MSPIGRVFIVLNLILAGTFVGFSGTHLQKQSITQEKLAAKEKELADSKAQWDGERQKLESDRNNFENAKTAAESAKGSLENSNKALDDENKALKQQLASMEGDLKAINAALAAANTEAKSAFAQSQEAYKMAIADQKVKDESVRAKDVAEAENRNLKTTIGGLEETVKSKELEIAGLHKERNELNLLVKVAQQNGFVPGLAAPPLEGTVASVVPEAGLCTINITANTANVDIQDQLNKRSFSFAIYDASGYKGEAVVYKYLPNENAVFCRLLGDVGKGGVKAGDSASTKTP